MMPFALLLQFPSRSISPVWSQRQEPESFCRERLQRFRRVCLFIALASVFPGDAGAARLTPEAIKAWDKYLEWADKKVERELSDGTRFLIQDYLPSQEKANVLRRLKAGEVVAERMKGVIPSGADFDIHDAAIHHWWGSILVPRLRLEDLLPFLQDYDHHAGRFVEVEKSRLLSKDGENYKFSFRLRRSKAVVTAYYNTEQECAYRTHNSNRASSKSRATRIAELESPGTPAERELPPGEDRGFLWRLVSWWRFQQTGDGVIVECESASLSRGIPFLISMVPGLRGYLESVPRESLENTLTSIRRHAPAWKKP
jgi:hypothetical protein